jgi:hypothetical protein
METEETKIGIAKEVYEFKKYISDDYDELGEGATPYEEHVLTYVDGILVEHTVNGKEV